MKRLIIVMSLLLCVIAATPQRSSNFSSRDRLFIEAKEMFADRNYAGCIDKLHQYKTITINPLLQEEVDFLLLASDFYQGSKEVSESLKNFLDTYPSSVYKNEVYFLIGSDHFANNDFRMAIYWLKQCDPSYLSSQDAEDCSYRIALSYLKNNQIAEAESYFSALHRTKRYDEASSYYLGVIALQQQDYVRATSMLSPLRNNPTYQPEARIYLNQINFAQGKYSETIKEGEDLLRNYPTHVNIREMERIVGASYYYQGYYDTASKYLKSYLDNSDKGNTNDYYMAGMCYYNLGDFNNAVRYLSLSSPEDNELGQNIYLHLGQAYLKTNDKTNALLNFEAASRMNYSGEMKEAGMYNYAMLLHQTSTSAFGESVTVLENFVNTYPNSQYADKVNDALVEVYLTTKNYDTALNSISKIKNPGNKILTAKQKIYYHLGSVEYTNNQYDKAIAYFSDAILVGNYAPTEKEQSIYWRGESYYKQGNYNKAIADFDSFLASQHNSAHLVSNAHYNLGYCYFKQSNMTKAQPAFLQATQAKNTNKTILSDAYARLGDCYFQNRQFAQAEKAYSQSVEAVPASGDYAIFQKGYVLGLQKNYQGKIDMMDQLIREYPQSTYAAEALYEKGRSYVLLKKNTEAIKTYRDLMSKYPNSNFARLAGLELGLVYYNSDQLTESMKAYKDVISKYPGSEEAQVAIQDLKSVYMDMGDVNGYITYVNSLGGSVKFDASEQDSLTYFAAERFFTNGDYAQAKKSMSAYLQSFPNGAFSTHAHYYLGNSYYQEKNYILAKPEFQYVLDQGSNQFTEQTLTYMARIAESEKNVEQALSYYERLDKAASNNTSRRMALIGIARTGFEAKKYNSVVLAVETLTQLPDVGADITNEALYYRGKSYQGLNETALAIKDLEVVAKDTRTEIGAEAKYLIASIQFNSGQNDKAKATVNDFIKQGTPHQYWLAKGFLLLSDIAAKEKDYLQARQYLESLKANYPNTNDDIQTLIQDRLNNLQGK
jgi:Uncharacterized protein conserved in bacteria